MKAKPTVGSVLLLASLMTANAVQARADDAVGEQQQNIEKFQKDAASAQHNISDKQAEIRTQRVKLKQDIAQYGVDSNQVRGDQQKLLDLRKQLADQQG